VRLPRLALPRGRGGTVFTIGRAASSDLRLTDMTVSWCHAELRQAGGDWVLADLGSTNGTCANGWRVGSGFLVRAGDRVTFGQVGFRLCDPPSGR
jgi:pSer/pThr/pTyr-binding forkhead associated (FHA) protein